MAWGLTDKWSAARNHFVKDYTQAPDISARVNLQCASLFWRHVGDRTHYFSWLGLSQRLRARFIIESRRLCFQFRQTEVQYFHDTVASQHDVFRLDVSVNDSGFMCGCQGQRYLIGNIQRFNQFQFTAAQLLS